MNPRLNLGRSHRAPVAAALGVAAALLLGLSLALGPGGAGAPPLTVSAVGTEPAADPRATSAPLAAAQPNALRAPAEFAASERVEVAAKPTPRTPRGQGIPRVPASEPALLDLAASLRLRLVDATGEPLARRSVRVRTWGGYHAAERTLVADGGGWVELELGQLRDRPRNAEFVAASAHDPALRSPVLQLGPEGPYGLLRGRVLGGDVALEPTPRFVSGRVLDGRGAAVAGAVLEVVPKGARDRPTERAADGGGGTTSDADGRFAILGARGAGPWQLVAAAEGRGTIAPVDVTPGETNVEVHVVELVSVGIELVLAPWMVAADFRVHFEAPGLPSLPLSRVSQTARMARFAADRLPVADGEIVVRWADFDEECVRIAAPLATSVETDEALEIPAVEMDRWVRSVEFTVRGSNDRHLSGARAVVRSRGGRGRTYEVGPRPVLLPRLRGPTTVRVEAAGYVALDVQVTGERADVVLQAGSRVRFRPPLSGAHGHRKLVWYWEPLDPEALCGGIASCAQRADADGVFSLVAPGSYRVLARGHGDSQFEWEGLLHVPFEPGETPLWLQDPDGDWEEFLEDLAARSPDG